MGSARALVLINYRRAGIGATSVYYLGTNTGRRLSGPRFHRRGPVLSIAPTTTTSNYSVYRTKTLSQQACSIRRLSAPPRRISAFGCIFLPFLIYLSLSSSSSASTASTVFVFRYLVFSFFFLSFLPLVPGSRRYLFLFSFLGPRRRLVPILVGDFRRCSSGPSLDKMHGEQLTRQRNGAKGKRRNMAWQNDTSRLSDTSERSLASDKLLILKSWPLSPLNPDKERYLARSGTKGPSGLDDPASLLFVHLSLSFFFFTFPFLTRPLFKRLDFPSFYPLCRTTFVSLTRRHFFPALAFFFPWSFLLSFLLDRSPWRRDSASRLSAATYISFLGIAKIPSIREFLFHRLQIFSCDCRSFAVAALLPYLFAPILCEIAMEELDSRRNENPEGCFLAALRTIGGRIRRNKRKLCCSTVNVSRRIFRVSVGCNYSEFRGFLSEASSWEY